MAQSSISLQWFPPSWVRIQSGTQTIHIDPAYLRTYFLHHPHRIEFSKWPDPIDGLPEAMEKADVILVTHHHKDHCKDVTVRRLAKRQTHVVAPRSCLRELGRDITVVEPGAVITLGDVTVEAVDAYNLPPQGSSRIKHKKGQGNGYLLRIRNRTIYHAGDTDCIPEMRHFGKIDVALLPVGGRGFTMDIESALKAVEILRAGVVIPMHRFEADVVDFKARAESRSATEVIALPTGGIYEMN